MLERHAVDVRTDSQNSVKHPPEDTTHLLKIITSIITCLTVHLYKNDSAFITGIQDLDVEEKALLRSKSQASGMSSHCWRRLDHELLTNRFHVTHHGGCAVLFNKDTFFPDVKVNSLYLHDIRRVLPDKVREG